MPTWLGNVLRSYEWQVGKPYGIAAVTAVPFLSRTATPGDMDYVNDQRSQPRPTVSAPGRSVS
jgi:hypothetical protein